MVLPTMITTKQGVIGGTFDAIVELFTDTGQTQPFDLSLWTWELSIERLDPLTEGAGLTLDSPNPGNIAIKIDPAVTATLERGKTHIVLSMTSQVDPTDVYYPVVGDIVWGTP
jgi:hypothetical protein